MAHESIQRLNRMRGERHCTCRFLLFGKARQRVSFGVSESMGGGFLFYPSVIQKGTCTMSNSNKNSKMNTVYLASLIICVLLAVWGIGFSDSLAKAASWLFDAVTVNFGWLYMLVMTAFVIFVLFIAFSKYGEIRLGPDDARPEHSNASWFAMLFGCGMGVGLVFYGAAEPMSHFLSPAAGIEPGSAAAADFAMRASFMHWGFHPWANYAVIGLGLAYFQFRKNKPALISTLFIPLLGEEKVKGPIGKVIDILAVFATIAGICTSLGLGIMQINGGLTYLFGLPNNKITWLILTVAIAAIYLWTAISGIDKGIKLIGDINLYVALTLMGLALIVGPTVLQLNSLVGGVGGYISRFFQDSFMLSSIGDNGWALGWRVYYWAWWIAWAPFVGIFIARISRGRTIREFILGVVIVPAIGSIIWFAVFGGMGLNLTQTLGLSWAQDAGSDISLTLFKVLANYPLGKILSLIAIFLLFTFFITSANSGTFVLGMLSEEGRLQPSHKTMFIWGCIEATLSYALLLSGGMKSVQTISIAAAFPFIFIMLGSMASILKALGQEHEEISQKKKDKAK
jgi:glycine betaine transporter